MNAGKYKGKKLLLPSLETTRSTKSILKNAFFNSIQAEIHGTHFIEMFGGSGSMGLEALSRGATHAYFIEKDPLAFKILEKNCANIDKIHTLCFNGDAFSELSRVIKIALEPIILYVDPPFSIRKGMDEIYEKIIKTVKKVDSSKVSLMAVEYMSGIHIPENLGNFSLKKTKRFGKSSLAFYI
ncbi:MAG: 16S rRNA (guanine(966)-N(2))-methyltransferase RsmD [Campylobacteraceae bacterium]|nr:16S rRNA (guanine(966)-N(2))-methyltransferase RsmD [Campylobacteraceae bacterium]